MTAVSFKHKIFNGLDSLNTTLANTSKKIAPTIEKVGALAFALLGAFSAHTSPKNFTAFFILGTALGINSYLNNKDSKEKTHKHGSSACVDGFFNEISGVKLPASALIVANFFITLCHIDHHANVYVPVAGIYCGAFAGKTFTHWLQN